MTDQPNLGVNFIFEGPDAARKYSFRFLDGDKLIEIDLTSLAKEVYSADKGTERGVDSSSEVSAEPSTVQTPAPADISPGLANRLTDYFLMQMEPCLTLKTGLTPSQRFQVARNLATRDVLRRDSSVEIGAAFTDLLSRMIERDFNQRLQAGEPHATALLKSME